MNNFKKISIVGNGLSAWMICAFMAKQLQHTDTKITLYLGVQPEIFSEIQSPLPLINDFFKAINISDETLESIGFQPKLGSAYLFDNKHPFFHVWGQYGAPLNVVEFHQVVMRAIQLNQSVDLNKLSIGSASVLAGKFKKPTQSSNSIYSTYESSWSFEAKDFLHLLISISRQMGVEINEEKVVRLAHDGNSAHVLVESGIAYDSNYLINTTPGLVADGNDLESWFESLPYELRSKVKKGNNLSSLANKVKVLDESSWLCETTHRNTAIWDVYQFAAQDSGGAYIHKKPRGATCLNFGPALVSMHSPVFSAIDLNLIAIKLLLRYFPSPTDGVSVAGEYNKALIGAYENLRDITQLCLSTLFEASGIKNKKITLSEQAEYKINLFKLRGRYPVLENEFFKTQWQIWLLLGLGCKPGAVEPMTSFVDEKVIKEHVAKVENSVLKELQSIPLAR